MMIDAKLRQLADGGPYLAFIGGTNGRAFPMTRDLLSMTGAALAAALMAWSIWGNPEEHSTHNVQTAQRVAPHP